jgi:hypothetical protein
VMLSMMRLLEAWGALDWLFGGLLAATIAYHVAGRNLSAEEQVLDETLKHPVAENAKGVVDVINRAGAIQALTSALPFVDPDLVLPAVTKYLAGGTAMLGIVDEQVRAGHLSAAQLNAWAGILAGIALRATVHLVLT